MFPDPMFFALFVLVLIGIIISLIFSIVRALRTTQSSQLGALVEDQPIVREREIIREIVKIRCPYCGNLYEEKDDKCPYCGGKKD